MLGTNLDWLMQDKYHTHVTMASVLTSISKSNVDEEKTKRMEGLGKKDNIREKL